MAMDQREIVSGAKKRQCTPAERNAHYLRRDEVFAEKRPTNAMDSRAKGEGVPLFRRLHERKTLPGGGAAERGPALWREEDEDE